MKKLIIALVAAFIAVSANAQVGIIAGLTSSSTDFDSAVADVQNVNQYHAGIAYKIGIGNLFTIQPAIIYNMKGTRLGDVELGDVGKVSDFNVDYKTGYLEVPVQLQVGFGLGSIARVFAFAEPFVGYAITNSVDMEYDGLLAFGSTKGETQTWDNVKNRLEYGVGLGVGAEVLKHIQVSVKYFWNMGEVYGKDINISNITQTVSEHTANGVAASVAFFF